MIAFIYNLLQMTKSHLSVMIISVLLLVLAKTQTTCTDNYQFPQGIYQISVQNQNGRKLILTMQDPVAVNDSRMPIFINKDYILSAYPTVNQLFGIKSNGNIYSTFGVQSYMVIGTTAYSSQAWVYIIFGDPAFINASPSQYNSTFYFQNCSNGAYRIYTTFRGYRVFLGIDFGRPNDANAFLAGTNYSYFLNPQLNYLNIVALTCQDNYKFSPGWYTITIRNNIGQLMTMTLKNSVPTNGSQMTQFIQYETNAIVNYPSAVYKFYIGANGNIQSSFGVQSFLSPNNQIYNSSEMYNATFVDTSLLNLNSSSNYSQLLYFQNCSDETYRIYSTFKGNKVYLGIDVGQVNEANAFFAGKNYLFNQNSQLNYLNIVPFTCQDNYQFTPGWYYISVTNNKGQQLYLTQDKVMALNDRTQATFQGNMYIQTNSSTRSQKIYISEYGVIYLKFGVQSFLFTTNKTFSNFDVKNAFFGDSNYIYQNRDTFSSQLYFQNCSNGTYRIYTTTGGNRGYMGIDAETGILAIATIYGTKYIYKYIPYTYLTITPYNPVICSNILLSPGRYYITVNDLSNNTYNIVTNGIVTNNSYQWNKVMDKDYYESTLSTNGSKQFWVENGPGKIHYFRTNNAVPAYMSPNSQINSDIDSQFAIMGDISYMNQAQGNRQLYVQNCSDLTYRIYSTFGGYTSYLGSNSTFANGGPVFFAGQRFLGQNYKLNIQQFPLANVQTCQQANAVSVNAATFYMTSDPQIGYNPFGRVDGDTNAMNIYDFLVTQIKNVNCPQSFVGIGGGMNHESNGYQARHNNLAAIDKAYFFADLIGNHDILPITSKYSMIPRKLTSNPFYWSNAVSIVYQYQLTTLCSGYQTVATTPNTAFQINNNAVFYNSYILGLYNKNSTNTNGSPIAYYVAIHNNFEDGLTALIRAKIWYNKQNSTVPIILVSHWVNSQSNGEKTGEANMLTFVNSLPVAAILVGHQTCNNAFMNDHCCRRNMPDDHYYANATLKNGTTVPITNSNNKTIPYINTSGIRDRIFFSISLNSTTVQIIRKAWTNGSKYGQFEVDNSKMAPLIYNFA